MAVMRKRPQVLNQDFNELSFGALARYRNPAAREKNPEKSSGSRTSSVILSGAASFAPYPKNPNPGQPLLSFSTLASRSGFVRFCLLPLLLVSAQRHVHFQQTLRQFHIDSLAGQSNFFTNSSAKGTSTSLCTAHTFNFTISSGASPAPNCTSLTRPRKRRPSSIQTSEPTISLTYADRLPTPFVARWGPALPIP